MRVTVMQIGIVRMRMDQAHMGMNMTVGFARWVIGAVLMAVVLVMHMGMDVLHRLMDMAVIVLFSQMQVQADDHQHGSRDKA